MGALMATIERITLKNSTDSIRPRRADEVNLPGLVIRVRSTTSSHSDYAELNLDEVLTSPLDRIITDGICS